MLELAGLLLGLWGEEEGTRDGEDESGDEGGLSRGYAPPAPAPAPAPAADSHGDGARGLQMSQTKYSEPHLLGHATDSTLHGCCRRM